MSVVSQGDALWFEESMGGHSAYRMKMDTVLAEEESEFQSILVFKNKMFGTVLALAGVVQCTSLDEHIYHEMMAHVPLMSMTQQGRDGLVVAIIGGGDGGVLREVVKYPHVKEVTLIDIDQRVIDLCREHMPEVSNGSFEDKRATILCQDGAEWLKTRNTDIDVLIIDSSDDDETGSNSALFNDAFYASVGKSLKSTGVVVKQSGCSLLQEGVTLSTLTRLRKHFPHYGVYRQNVPTYVGGDMQITWATHSPGAVLGPLRTTTGESVPIGNNTAENSPDGDGDTNGVGNRTDNVKDGDSEESKSSMTTKRPRINTKYYNAQVHSGAFALPSDLQRKIDTL